MANTTLNINGKDYSAPVDGNAILLYVLRDDLGLTGTKFGCGMAQCGACTVHLDGNPVRACITPVSQAIGTKVTTVEGLAVNGKLSPPATGVDRQSGTAVWLLPVGATDGGDRAPEGESASFRKRRA